MSTRKRFTAGEVVVMVVVNLAVQAVGSIVMRDVAVSATQIAGMINFAISMCVGIGLLVIAHRYGMDE